MAVGRNTALVQFALVALAMAALMHAYVTSDFSVLNVVQNSHTDKPLLYKITGVWGNHEGSMLLWIFMLERVRRGARAVLRQPAARPAGPRAVGAWHDRVPASCCSSCSPRTRSCAPGRRRRTATASTRCCRIPASRSIRRSSISAMSDFRSPSPSPSPRSSKAASMPPGHAGSGRGLWPPGAS